MDDKLLLEAIRQMIREETGVIVDEKLKTTEANIMRGVTTLMDSQFMGQFALLAEGQELILQKMPSEDDMDIIDGRLQEHDDEIKILRRDVNELKRAQ